MDSFRFKAKPKLKIEIAISQELANAFRDAKILSAWGKLRPSCQQDYIDRVEKAPAGELRRKEIEKIIKFTNKYAVRHPNKYGRAKKAVVVN